LYEIAQEISENRMKSEGHLVKSVQMVESAGSWLHRAPWMIKKAPHAKKCDPEKAWKKRPE
jgi:hypothetical protein